jgi:hypothetical protein
MSDIQWEPNLAGSSTIGSDPKRLGQYYLELSPNHSAAVQVLILWETGPNPPLRVWYVEGDATPFAESVAHILYRYGLQAVITRKGFTLPPDL